MSRLRIFSELSPNTPIFSTRRPERIASRLSAIGVRFERWRPRLKLNPGASAHSVLAAFAPDIDRLKKTGGYRAVDVVSIDPSHPQKSEMRTKFLNEHTHAEDEVRFFVAGSGLFTMHVAERVFEVLCRAGDLIALPAGTKHWFDMGASPSFIAIRLFTNPEGWVATFTDSPIAEQFPRYERVA